ncbi:MAG: hypothetical protein V4722_25565 [Bacteroidota bacterium]
MRTTITLIALTGMTMYATAQGNVGIGTDTPGSTLTVNGSMAGGYTSVTANTYTILANDYYIVWNQTTVPSPGVGIFSLPAAAVLNKGRIYKIRNNSNTYAIALNTTGTVLIDNVSSLNIPPNYSLEIIANGNTAASTTCWEVISLAPTLTGDGIRNAFASTGCASCAAYDAAITDTWLQITGVEYNALLNRLNSVGTYFASPIQMNTTPNNPWSGGHTVTENFFTQSVFPAGNYPIAMSIRTGINAAAPSTMQGLKLKMSSTSQTSGYADIPAPGASTPNIAGTPAINTIYYYVLKRPTQKSSTGGPSNIAVFTPITNQLGVITTGGSSYYGTGDVSNTPGSIGTTNLVQVVGTAMKQW